jgi:hypothetical protein
VHNLSVTTSTMKSQYGDRHWQFEAAGTRTARVYIQNSAALFGTGLMGMAGDHNTHTRRCWIDVEFREIVKHVNRMGPNLDDFSRGKSGSPGTSVVITANGPYRRNSRQRLQDGTITDIPGMNNQI